MEKIEKIEKREKNTTSKSMLVSEGKEEASSIKMKESSRPNFSQLTQPEGEVGANFKCEPTRYHDWEIKGRCSDF